MLIFLKNKDYNEIIVYDFTKKKNLIIKWNCRKSAILQFIKYIPVAILTLLNKNWLKECQFRYDLVMTSYFKGTYDDAEKVFIQIDKFLQKKYQINLLILL